MNVEETDVEAVLDVLRSGWLTMGPRTAEFEAALADWIGARHVVAVSSGAAALHLACLAADLGSGDEAIVVAPASSAAPRLSEATTVVCEPPAVPGRITGRTKAVLASRPSDMRGLRKLCDDRGLVFIDDAGESLAGTVGHIGCFSFFGNSPLAIGQAGALTTDDDAFAAKARSLRSHAMTSVTWDRHRGHADSYDVVDIGFNYRIDEMRAALGLSRLSRLKPRD